MYCTPHSTLVCGEGVSTQVSRRGLSVRGKVAMCSRRDLGYVPCASSSKVKMAGKARSPASYPLVSPCAERVSGAAWAVWVAPTGVVCLHGVAAGAWIAGVGWRPVSLG